MVLRFAFIHPAVYQDWGTRSVPLEGEESTLRNSIPREQSYVHRSTLETNFLSEEYCKKSVAEHKFVPMYSTIKVESQFNINWLVCLFSDCEHGRN